MISRRISKKQLQRLTALLPALLLCVVILFISTGCDRDEVRERETEREEQSQGEETGTEVIVPNEPDFDLLMDDVFAEWVSNDTLSMNYYLADPYKLDIERPEPTFGKVISQEMIEESRQETQELSDRLDGFNYDLLRDDQKIVYDILRRSIEISRILDKEDDFAYYTGYIRPLTGIQVQLPVLLAEFSFYTAEDIGRYLDLIEDTHRYFSEIIEFERERSRRGFFLGEANVDSVIEQIESYLENREDNLLITVFNDRIDNYEGLSDEQRRQYKQRNEELVLGNVLAAYDSLLEAMKELRGVGARSGGLATLPEGENYAHTLLRLRVGTDKSVQDLERLLEGWISYTFISIITKLQENQDLSERFHNGSLGQISEGTPGTYISELRKLISKNFPPIEETDLNILEVHESLQEHMSPAFYLVPAVDRFNDNVIYINPSSLGDDNLFLFTVLAHESYPGHMYQTVYFLQQSPHPVRITLSNTGYSEGWATYAEMTSYFLALPDYYEAELMWEFRLYDLLIQAYSDFGVNVLGWSLDDLFSVLQSYGINMQVAENLFNMVTGVPLTSTNYSLGYIELMELINEAQQTQGESFEFIDFNRFFLGNGPAPYPIIRERMIAQNPGVE